MKRSRDAESSSGVTASSSRASGRVNGHRSEVAFAPPTAATGRKPKLTNADARAYLNDVKNMLKDEWEKYKRFLEILIDCKLRGFGIADVGRVKELFEGHPNVIIGFNKFLPEGYEIPLPDEEADSHGFNMGEDEQGVDEQLTKASQVFVDDAHSCC